MPVPDLSTPLLPVIFDEMVAVVVAVALVEVTWVSDSVPPASVPEPEIEKVENLNGVVVALRSTVPPVMDRAFVETPSLSTAPAPRRIVPALIEIPPLKLLAEEVRTRTPAPDFVSMLVPTMEDSTVIAPRVLFAVMGVLLMKPLFTVPSKAPDKVKAVKILAEVLLPRSNTGVPPARPETVTAPAKVPPAPRLSVPALMVVRPLYVLAFEVSSNVPAPSLVRANRPPTAPPNDSFPEPLTVMLRAAVSVTAPDDCVRSLVPAKVKFPPTLTEL